MFRMSSGAEFSGNRAIYPSFLFFLPQKKALLFSNSVARTRFAESLSTPNLDPIISRFLDSTRAGRRLGAEDINVACTAMPNSGQSRKRTR